MRLGFFSLTIVVALAGETAFAKDRSSPLEPIQGYELRLLDRKIPVEITTKDKMETKEMPVWIFIPVKPSPEHLESIDEITQPDDLASGTALLPPPPDGFGLRALKLPLRAATQLDNGRSLVVEVPVFIYYRHLLPPLNRAEPREPVAAIEDQSVKEPTLARLQAENTALRSQVADLQQEFTALVRIVPDGTAKEQLKVLVQRMSAITPVGASIASARTADSNIN